MGRKGPSLPPAPTCPVCSRTVYHLEAVYAADRTPYHKKCLNCGECGRKLDTITLNEHEKQLYCNCCYQGMFQAKSDILINDRRKMQVLPVAGKYDKKEALGLASDAEYRRREEAVMATRRAMAE